MARSLFFALLIGCALPVVSAQSACFTCESSLEGGERFCPQCGDRVRTYPQYCYHCGSGMRADWRFCAECGTPGHHEPGELPVPVPIPLPEPIPEPWPRPVPGPEQPVPDPLGDDLAFDCEGPEGLPPGDLGGWSLSDVRGFDSARSLRSATIGDGSASRCTLVVPAGVAQLRFAYFVSAEAGYDLLRLLIDDADCAVYGDTGGEWRVVEVMLDPSASHTIGLEYRKDGGTAAGEDAAWVDDIRYLGVREPEPVEAELSFENVLPRGARGNWVADGTLVAEGDYSLHSGPTPHNGSSAFEIVAPSGATRVDFQYLVSSEQGYDRLVFEVDGVQQAVFDNTEEVWSTASVELGEGQTLRWVYRKDTGTIAGRDTAWIDNIRFFFD